MHSGKPPSRSLVLGLVLATLAVAGLARAAVKLRVIAENAEARLAPDIGSSKLASVPLNTLLDASEKKDGWYKVLLEQDGVRVSGYIHEMLVEELQVAAPASLDRVPAGQLSDAEVAARIEQRLEEARALIRDESDLPRAVETLRHGLALAFNLGDLGRQRSLAAQLFLWSGIAFSKQGEDYRATRELKNMFIAAGPAARDLTRNLSEPRLVNLVDQAEKEYLGIVSVYALEVQSEPEGATVRVEGKEVGRTPLTVTLISPQLVLEIEKKGFQPVREPLTLSKAVTRASYTLAPAGIEVEIRSQPERARILLDGRDTGRVTNSVVTIPYGAHEVRLERDRYAPWKTEVKVDPSSRGTGIEAQLVAADYSVADTWGGPGAALFQRPSAVAIDPAGNVIVTDPEGWKLRRLSPGGEPDNAWGEGGKSFKKLKAPAGVAVDVRGHVYVTDAERNNVFHYDASGAPVDSWGGSGDGEKEFKGPSAIAVDQAGDLYVVDWGNSRIKKYTSQGVLRAYFGTRGAADGQFVDPRGIAVNARNEVWVLDASRLQKFSADGGFLKSLNRAGDVALPAQADGLWIDARGMLYVGDPVGSRILKMDEDGDLVAEIRGRDGMDAAGGAASPGGTLYVVEKSKQRVVVLKPAE